METFSQLIFWVNFQTWPSNGGWTIFSPNSVFLCKQFFHYIVPSSRWQLSCVQLQTFNLHYNPRELVAFVLCIVNSTEILGIAFVVALCMISESFRKFVYFLLKCMSIGMPFKKNFVLSVIMPMYFLHLCGGCHISIPSCATM